MTDLDALLEGIVADPANALRWLVMADWLEENGQPERAELVRVHRELLRTCTATRETKARKQLHARMMELMRAGVQPCLPQRTVTLPGGVEMRFSFIPPGSFLMGNPALDPLRKDNPSERRCRVNLTKGFWFGEAPVTQRQWRAVMGSNPSHFPGDDLPVECVNWFTVQEFLGVVKRQLGVTTRLPTVAEWEFAARAGTTTAYFWGSELNGTQANCRGDSPFGTLTKGSKLEKTTPVGAYSNVSPHPWGLADIIGNVWELCADWWQSFPKGNPSDPRGSDIESFRLFRGGGWASAADRCRVTSQVRDWSGFQSSDFGFRLAADLSVLA